MVIVPSGLTTRPESAGAVHAPVASLPSVTVTGSVAPSGVKVMSRPVTFSTGGTIVTLPSALVTDVGLAGIAGSSGVGTGTTAESTSGEDTEPFSATTVTAVPSATFSAGMVIVPSGLTTRPESAGAVHVPVASLLTTTVTG
ncbi:Uncharacterised protein [Streptococcus suis]|nr:Uncharacterised protein [Streptococcus suis]